MGQEPRAVVWALAALEDLVMVLENAAQYTPGLEAVLHEDVAAAAASLPR